MEANAPSFGKMVERPDIVKLSKLHFQYNSFTRGVLDGDLHCSALPRKPAWDFSKNQGKKGLSFHSYFQPGQYEVKLDAVRENGGKVGAKFESRPRRQPIVKPISHGPSVIPDRSLARICEATLPKQRSADIAKQST